MSNYDLIVKDLHEVVGADSLRKISAERTVKVYWGTAPTGRIHIGYYIPLLKIAELIKAGCKVTILIADLHAILDNYKSTEMQVSNRSDYYIKTLKVMLAQLQVNLDQLDFVLGSSFQLSPEYTRDVYRLNAICTLKDVQNAGAEVVKQASNPTMTGLMYPTLQALDEHYLKVDAQLGGVDQRKIFMFSREFLPKLGYKKRIHLLTPMVSGLRCSKQEAEKNEVEAKMSTSNEKTKLDMLDSRAQIKKKVNSAYCLSGDIKDNSLLDILDNVIFPLLEHNNKDFVIFRREEHGGPISFSNIETVKNAYVSEELHPADLKAGVIDNLDMFIEPVRKEFESGKWRQILKHAYD